MFFLLWLGAYFQLDLMKPIHAIFASIYAVANSGFYFMVFVTLMFVFAIIYITRWLDYWEILPNEILHHHGPLSDLERYPTMNLKFDKEIPDVLECLLLGAGRLVLHVPNVSKALVLDNVLFINRKEEALKRVMSRLEVRVTTDQEAGEATLSRESDGDRPRGAWSSARPREDRGHGSSARLRRSRRRSIAQAALAIDPRRLGAWGLKSGSTVGGRSRPGRRPSRPGRRAAPRGSGRSRCPRCRGAGGRCRRRPARGDRRSA